MDLLLECNACKTPDSMSAVKIPRFNKIVRVIGVILMILSGLGLLFAIFVFLTSIFVPAKGVHTQGLALFAGILISLFIGAIALIGGLISWFLLSKKNVYECLKCNFISDTAKTK